MSIVSDTGSLTQCCARDASNHATNTTRRRISLSDRPTYYMSSLTYPLVMTYSYCTLLYPRVYPREITEPKWSAGLAINTRYQVLRRFFVHFLHVFINPRNSKNVIWRVFFKYCWTYSTHRSLMYFKYSQRCRSGKIYDNQGQCTVHCNTNS